MFQSTYLYKVRHQHAIQEARLNQFQSTYLYKVRHICKTTVHDKVTFQSTYLYKVRRQTFLIKLVMSSFNPRTYIRYDDRVG